MDVLRESAERQIDDACPKLQILGGEIERPAEDETVLCHGLP